MLQLDNIKYVIFGAGDYGKKYASNKKSDLCLFLDNKVLYGEEYIQQDTGIKIVNPEYYFASNTSDKFIVIAIKEWVEVANYLEKKGKRFFYDYIPSSLIGYNTIDIGFFKIVSQNFDPFYWLDKFANKKKIAACYGECHMTLYEQLLNSSEEFAKDYIFLSMPNVNDYTSSYIDLLKNFELWSKCDLLLINESDDMNNFKKYYPGKIMNSVKKDCKIIRVTPALWGGYFPQTCSNRGTIVDWDYFTWEDKNINVFIQKHKEKECVYELSRDNYYSVEWLKKYESRCFKILARMEKGCDVKILDYIDKHWKEKILFYSPTHPINEVIEEIAYRILLNLGIDYKVHLNKQRALATHGVPIYPSVLKYIGINKNGEKISPGNDGNVQIDFEEYITEYIKNATK